MTVRILTDSVSDIPSQIAVKLGIMVLPLKNYFGSKAYDNCIDLTSEQFFGRLSRSSVLLFTSELTPQDFTDACDNLIEEADEIVVITISNILSGNYWE